MSCISATHDPQLARLADAIAQRVGSQRFNVWFNNSTKLDLKQDGLDISVPNDFISEWIGRHFTRPIQEAAHEVLGCTLALRFFVVPELFETRHADDADATNGHGSGAAFGHVASATTLQRGANGRSNGHDHVNGNGHGKKTVHARAATIGRSSIAFAGAANGSAAAPSSRRDDSGSITALPSRSNGAPSRFVPSMPGPGAADRDTAGSPFMTRSRLRHDLSTFVVGASNQLAFNAANYVSEYPGGQYNPLFVHGSCGLGKTHMLQGLCRRFIENHPTKRWMYLTGEEFTNEFLTAMKANKLDAFRRKMRDLDLLVIDDVHFLSGKRATQEEFLHTFNAIEATGRQVVMASDNHPKMIDEFGESLINRFVSGMVVRIDPPNFATRCDILRAMSQRGQLGLSEEVIGWVARRVTQNVRELEGAITRIAAHVKLSGRPADVALAQESLGDLDRQLAQPTKPENILLSVCDYFGLESRDLMSGRRQRTISLARSVAMYLVRKTAKLSFPEIGMRMGKRNHSTVISACRRIERAVAKNEVLAWSSAIGERSEEAQELIQRLEDHARSAG